MAEFKEVVSQIKRMCTKQNYCYECPMRVITYANGGNKPLSCIAAVCDDEVERLEKTVMDWAEKHPEPRYPSWKEWWEAKFHNADSLIRPCMFESEEYFGCKNFIGCEQCINTPIPADIAKKLGIKPIGWDADA